MLAECLASFPSADPTTDGIEVVVVDDASIDDTVAVVDQFAARVTYPVRCVANEGARQNAGRNTGVRRSAGEVIVFVDDDEQLVDDYFSMLDALIRDHPEGDCFGGPYLELPGKQLRTCAQCSLAAKAVAQGPDRRYRGLLGGNMAIRRSAFSLVGEFDETLTGLGNESEWFQRAHRSGTPLTIVYDDALAVWHRRDHESLRTLASKAYREGLTFHRYLERTHQTPSAKPELVPRYAAHAIVRRCANGVFLAARETGRTIGAWRARRQPEPAP